MTLRAWIITLRGRVRDALCPELQVLRDRLAHVQDALDDEFDRGRWQAERDEARAYREAYFKLLKMVSEVKAMEPGCPVFLATPPQGNSPTRRPLTDEEIENCRRQGFSPLGLLAPFDFHKAARAIERAHKIGGNDE
jgi:hypothetical protein